MRAKAVVFSGKDSVEIMNVNLRVPERGEVLIETACSCVSPGTELRCLRGKEKNASRFPFVPGYSLSGTVIAAGRDVLSIKPGDRVFCHGTVDAGGVNIAWGGHISHALCGEDDVEVIPAGISMADASMTAVAAIAFHGTMLSRPKADEKVAVVGLGIIGRFSAALHALSGAEVVACDISPDRVESARNAGIEAFVSGDNPAGAFRKRFSGGADIVIDATGTPAVTEKAVSAAKDIPWDNSPVRGARFVIQGSYENSLRIPYHDAFNREISVYFPRSQQKKDRLSVLDIMDRGLLKMHGLTDGVHSFESAPACYGALGNPKRVRALTFIFEWK